MSRKRTTPTKTVSATARVVQVKRVLDPVSSHFDLRARVTTVIAAQRQAVLARRGSYRAAANPRSRNQTPYGGSADQQADAYSRRLARELSRDMDRNADSFRALYDAWVSAVFGQCVRYRPTTDDAEWNRQASEALHRRMQKVRNGVDVRELRSGYQLLSDYVRAAGVDGEAGIIKLDNGQAQAVESEQITNGGRYTGDSIDGVNYDKAGKVVSFTIVPYNTIGALDTSKGQDFDSANVIWTAMRSRFSQTRGMPTLIAALDNWERLDSYMESEVIAAEQGSQIYAAIERQSGDMGFGTAFSPTDASVDPSTIMRGGTNASGGIDWAGTTAGAIMELPNGAKYVPVDPKRPSRDAAPFLIEMLRLFCNNLGLPYEFVFNDLRGLSWSINRALVQMARDRIGITQSLTFGPAFSAFYTWQLAVLIESGELKEVEGWDRHELAWPQISWPDEGKEYEAQAFGLEHGLTSRHRLFGPAWRTFMDERAEELEYASELAATHNKQYPDFEVMPWFFLGFQPANDQGVAKEADTNGELTDKQKAQRQQAAEKSAANRKKVSARAAPNDT